MTQTGSIYGQALYTLAVEEGLAEELHGQLLKVQEIFDSEPSYLRLLSAVNIPRQERCALLDETFGGRVHAYVLNFLKILTERGYAKQFSSCLEAYTGQFYADNSILVVEAVSAVPLSPDQIGRLEGKLCELTGKKARIDNRVDPKCIGGVMLEYDGTQVDGSVSRRLEDIRKLLKNTVL